jgi:hypothetical protein
MPNSNPTGSVLLVGGPDSGKTNFITRLWLAIKRNDGVVRQNGLPDHLDYLEGGAQEFLTGHFVHHTPTDVYSANEIPFRVDVGGNPKVGTLIIPDCSGEKWMEIYRKREWSNTWEQHISAECACLIFLRANSPQTVASLDWLYCERLWGGPVSEAALEKPDAPPTQVVLTEFIQFIGCAFRNRVGGGFRPRVGIVITAWDAVPVDRQNEGPRRYIETEFPLLHQFLCSNGSAFQYECFGVSVAGGDFDTEPGFRAQWIAQDDPLKSGFVCYDSDNGLVRSPDLTAPIAWALGTAALSGVVK